MGGTKPTETSQGVPETTSATVDQPAQKSAEQATVQAEASQQATELKNENFITVSLNSGTLAQVLPSSIIASTESPYTQLKDEKIKDKEFQVNTVSDSLFIRTNTGEIISSLGQNEVIKATGKFLVFQDPSTQDQILMLEVEGTTTRGYVAAPYLKSKEFQLENQPGALSENPQASNPEPAQEQTTQNTQEVLASKPDELMLVGDSIVEGVKNRSPQFKVAGIRGRSTKKNLQFLQTEYAKTSNNKFANIKSIVLFGGINDFGRDGTGASVLSVLQTITETVSFLKSKGVQPVLSTIYEISNHPKLNSKIISLNEGIQALAKAERIPLIDFSKIKNQSGAIHPSSAVYDQMKALIDSNIKPKQ